MNESDQLAFTVLFKAATIRCFGQPQDRPFTESESRHLSQQIEEQTGLVIGWKSLKNYAAFIVDAEKPVNPSIATLDTLVRYVAGAPAITEIQRKKQANNFAYWYRYREQYPGQPTLLTSASKRKASWPFFVAGFILLSVVLGYYLRASRPIMIAEHFNSVETDSLQQQGWWLQLPYEHYWERRGENAGQLTLFTLPGDNWPQTGTAPGIRNLLLHKISGDCFHTELQLSDFMPLENWQQAGLLLLEDTAFAGKSIRLSLAYNDFFGGYSRPGEIIIQAIAAYGKAYPNLEEIVHQPLFTLGGKEENLRVANNLKSAGLRIEKRGRKFRFLYAASPTENFSFKELTTYDFDMHPKYVGIFALKGFVDSTAVVPVRVRFFRLEAQDCD